MQAIVAGSPEAALKVATAKAAGRTGTHHARSEARRKTLQILYQSQVTGLATADILDEELYIAELGLPCNATRLLLKGVEENVADIDALIASTSEHWALERMPLVDLNILRLAIFEMLYLEDVPQSVAINEAVELAKCFGGEDDSSRFVNGVLGRIANQAPGSERPPRPQPQLEQPAVY
ncbi:MAG: transcription antitermination factor NusB [Coriobacteriales bacterium]|jgi:N utilization substance protein B|nr:transcription antitermination factor NusB [Coriobacteriales bacterium]